MTIGPIPYMPASEMRPDPSAWEEYHRAFPHRFLRWNTPRQLWEVWQANPVLGCEEFIEFVFWYEPVFDDEGAPIPEADMAELIRTGSPRVRKGFRPFDHRFARQRIQAAYEFRDLGVARYHDRLAALQRQARLHRIRGAAREMAAGFEELRRWLPALTSGYADERIPLVPGASLQ